jgi:hypothetical protein
LAGAIAKVVSGGADGEVTGDHDLAGAAPNGALDHADDGAGVLLDQLGGEGVALAGVAQRQDADVPDELPGDEALDFICFA